MGMTKLISDEEVRNVLRLEDLIPLMKTVFQKTSSGEIQSLPRQSIFCPNKNIFAVMTAALPWLGVCGCKTAVFPGPEAAGTAQSVINLFDIGTGELTASVSAECITVARTAASTAAATDVLARRDANVLCLLGAGTQALAHALAICKIRDIREVRFWDIYPAGADAACEKFAKWHGDIRVCAETDVREAVRDADIVCTVSKAPKPILAGDWLSPGTHVNAVGACGPIFREIDSTVLARARVFVDQMDSAMHSAGDLLIPIKTGEYKEDDIEGEIGAVSSGTCKGRSADDDSEITLFETCGLAAQDIAAAYAAWKGTDGETFRF